jgi:hypothetical protein
MEFKIKTLFILLKFIARAAATKNVTANICIALTENDQNEKAKVFQF